MKKTNLTKKKKKRILNEENADKTVSRQRRYQRRKEAEKLCTICAAPQCKESNHYCKRHHKAALNNNRAKSKYKIPKNALPNTWCKGREVIPQRRNTLPIDLVIKLVDECKTGEELKEKLEKTKMARNF